MDRFQHMHVLHNACGGSFFFSGICSNLKSRNDYLSNSIDKFVYGSSPNPPLPAFRGTFREASSPVRSQDSVNHDRTLGTFMAYSFMNQFARAAVEAPFIRLKLLLQNQRELIKSGRLSTPYKGITDCLVRIIKNEGLFSPWKGNSALFLQIIPSQVLAIVFTATFRNIVYNFKRDANAKRNWIFGNSVAGIAGSASTLLFTYPLVYAHTRLASDIKCVKTGGERQFNGLIDVWRKTLRSDGVRGIYRGFNIGYMVIILDHRFYIPTHKRDPSKPSSRISLIRPILIGVACTLAAHPCDTVARRMMMTSGETFKYKSSIDAFSQIIRNEGIKSLYNGFGANMLRVLPLMYLSFALNKSRDHNGPSTSISVVLRT